VARSCDTASSHALSGTARKRLAILAAHASGGVARWMTLAFGAELLLAAAVLGTKGITENGIVLSLRLTARLAFPLFWLAYAGGPLATLFGPRLQPLRRVTPVLGLAFAAAMTVHLALVATLCVVGPMPAAHVFVIFGTAAACMYAMALFSIPQLRQALGERGWKIVSLLAMNYVGLAFLNDFSTDFFARGLKHALLYWPFLALTVAAPTLRVGAYFRGMRLAPARPSSTAQAAPRGLADAIAKPASGRCPKAVQVEPTSSECGPKA
jgi:hypothetical protein